MKAAVVLSTMLALAVAGCASPECYKVPSGTSGWNAVDAIPGYGIQGDIVQFLSTTRLTFWERPGEHVKLEGVREEKAESTTFRFTIENPAGRYRHLKVTFLAPMAGMKVDAFAFDRESGSRVRLLDDERIFEDSVAVFWPDIKVSAVEIALHVHLSPRPILKEFAVGASGLVAEVDGIDDGFKRDGALFFYRPDGGERTLCQKPKLAESIPLSMVRGKTVSEIRTAR